MFKISTQSPNIPQLDYTADASVAFTQGSVGYRDTSTGEIKEDAGGNEATTLTIESVIAETKTTASSNPLIRDRKSTRLNTSHIPFSRMPSSA